MDDAGAGVGIELSHNHTVMHNAPQSIGILDIVVLCALPFGMTKDKVLQIRLTEDEKSGFEAAAELAGIPLASWVRERLRLAAIRDLESAGLKIPFVKAIELRGESNG